MGTGRSGSTILEILLAAAPGVHGGGELFDVIEDGLIRNVTCSCGAAFADCPVWRPVAQAITPLIGNAQTANANFRRVEWHAGFWRRWLARKPLPELYVRYQQALIHALQRASGQVIVIDSSKYAGRALALQQIYGRSLKVIWIVRRPSGILHSLRKPNPDEQRPKPLWHALPYVAYVTLCCRLARARLRDDCYVLHYEDLLNDPAATIARLGQWAHMDLNEVATRVSEGAPFSPGHVITGNRLRRQGSVRLKAPPDQHQDLPPTWRAAAWLLDRWYAALSLTR
jgi:hypothetical protein